MRAREEIRPFTFLPMHECTDEERGGPGREEHEAKKFDPLLRDQAVLGADAMTLSKRNETWRLAVDRRVYVQLARTGTQVTRMESHQKKIPSHWVRTEDHCLLRDRARSLTSNFRGVRRPWGILSASASATKARLGCFDSPVDGTTRRSER